jgi:hypothetical protein
MEIDLENVHYNHEYVYIQDTEDAISKLEELLEKLRNQELVIHAPKNRYPGSGVFVDEDHDIIHISLHVPKRK